MANLPTQVSNRVRQWGHSLLSGAIAGAIAAIPMALVMTGLHRVLPAPKGSWYIRLIPVSPKQITHRLARRVGLKNNALFGQGWDPATWLGHLGYGAATASLYPLATRPLPLPGILRGMIFALGVWAASYMGWLPAVNILPPATKEPARRNAVLIVSHLVWGSIIGLLASRIDGRFSSISDQ